GELDAGSQFGDADRGDDHVVVGRECVGCLTPLTFGRDEHTGIEDQSAGHVGSVSSTASRAAATSLANSSSTGASARSATTSDPLLKSAGPTVAMRLPPRVMMIVSP